MVGKLPSPNTGANGRIGISDGELGWRKVVTRAAQERENTGTRCAWKCVGPRYGGADPAAAPSSLY